MSFIRVRTGWVAVGLPRNAMTFADYTRPLPSVNHSAVTFAERRWRRAMTNLFLACAFFSGYLLLNYLVDKPAIDP